MTIESYAENKMGAPIALGDTPSQYLEYYAALMGNADRLSVFWSRMLAVLRRDFRSFFRKPSQNLAIAPPGFSIQGQSTSLNEEEVLPEALPPVSDPPLPPLLDPAQLERVKYCREIRDWRDETIVKLGSVGRSALNDFSNCVKGLFKDISIWRYAWPEPADEALRVDFGNRVRLKIQNEMLQSEMRLTKLLIRWPSRIPERKLFIYTLPNNPLICISQYGFGPSKYEQIVADIGSLVMGELGMVPTLQVQVTNIAERLMKKGPT